MRKRLKARLETLSRRHCSEHPFLLRLTCRIMKARVARRAGRLAWQRTVVGMAKVTLAEALDQLTVEGVLIETLDRGLQPHA